MKRKFVEPSKSYHAKLGDIKSDFTPAQRRALGEVALNYNEMEGYIDTLFHQVTNIPDVLGPHVSSRINGLEGKVEVIKIGARALGLSSKEMKHLEGALGEGVGFLGLKSHRDAVGSRYLTKQLSRPRFEPSGLEYGHEARYHSQDL